MAIRGFKIASEQSVRYFCSEPLKPYHHENYFPIFHSGRAWRNGSNHLDSRPRVLCRMESTGMGRQHRKTWPHSRFPMVSFRHFPDAGLSRRKPGNLCSDYLQRPESHTDPSLLRDFRLHYRFDNKHRTETEAAVAGLF